MNTAKEMYPAIGQQVAVRFEEITVNCTVRNVKSSYGRTRLLVSPDAGQGVQWIELPRVVRRPESAGLAGNAKVLQGSEPEW